MSANEAPPSPTRGEAESPSSSRRSRNPRGRLAEIARSLVTLRDLVIARRALLAPMAFAMIPLFWVIDATHRS